jgi:hypothetical protein
MVKEALFGRRITVLLDDYTSIIYYPFYQDREVKLLGKGHVEVNIVFDEKKGE